MYICSTTSVLSDANTPGKEASWECGRVSPRPHMERWTEGIRGGGSFEEMAWNIIIQQSNNIHVLRMSTEREGGG